MSTILESAETVEQVEFEEVGQGELSVETVFAEMVREVVSLSASDIYFNGNETELAVSIRHLGMVKPWTRFEPEEGRRLLNYIKASAGMDLAQKHRPLDGRWVSTLDEGRMIDLRISTIPTLYGEDMSIRLLQRDLDLLELNQLGLDARSRYDLATMLGRPGGLVLVTGPAGTGKTTTLYACLHRMNDGSRRINTIEDPIEYALPGIRQSQVHAKIGLDFPELLRGVLRQTPDVIMVGEIRDPLTAQTTVRAANSGHLVFATLHAPVAAAAIDSMLALGVPPHFLATSLAGIVSQRLVRTLCPECRIPIDLNDGRQTFRSVQRWLEPGQGRTIYGPGGCEQCRQEGYAGRTGVFEVLRVDGAIRRMILDGRSAREIHDSAVEKGMTDLRSAALLKVAAGLTTTEELARAIPNDQVLPDE